MQKRFRFLISQAIIFFVFFFTLSSVHAITKEKAEESLKALDPNVKVMSVKKTPIKGLWELIVQSGGKKGIVYIDETGKNIVLGSIYNLTTMTNITQQRFNEINRVDFSKIPLQDSLVLGNPKAKNKVVIFDDPDCPYCAKLHPELKKVVQERKDVAFYIKMFPLLKIHPKAYDKAKAIMCQDSNEKGLKLLEDAFAKKEVPKPACDTKVVDEHIKLGEKLGISGTPALIFQNGRKVSGYINAETIKKLIDSSS